MSQLSGLQQTYVTYIVQLLNIKNNNTELYDYAKQLIILLKYIINFSNNIILTELAANLESILIIYIFDLTDLLNQQLNFDKCYFRYKNLKSITSYITNFMIQHKQYGYYDSPELELLKKKLLCL